MLYDGGVLAIAQLDENPGRVKDEGLLA